MRITVKVKLNSKIESVEIIDEKNLAIKVRARPIDGEANKRIIELLSEYYKVPKSRIEIVSGLKSKTKIIEIK